MWSEDNIPDIIVKVTNVCSTDPNDPTHSADPTYVKVDWATVKILYLAPSAGIDESDLEQPVYPKGVY